jgi:hypothetical protein
MSIEVYDVLALVFGIWLNIRKLDVRKLQPEDYPKVPPAEFRRWQDRAASAYSLGSLVCFLKLALDYALKLGGPRVGIPWAVIRIAGLSLFLGWVGTLIFVWVRAFQAGKLRDQLGIGPPPRRPPDPDPDGPPPEPGPDEN